MPSHIRMDRHREAELVVLSVEVVEVVAPQVLHISRIHPPVRVRRFLDEHHRWKIVQVPICGDLNQPGGGSLLEWLHPVVGVLVVVDGGPAVADAEVVREAVVVAEGVVVFHAVL